MYSKQEATRLRKDFWTTFGQYMRPVRNSEGEFINWVNYKTGNRHIYFRMDADNISASVAIELHHPDLMTRNEFFVKFNQLKAILLQLTGEEWDWEAEATDETGKTYSRIGIAIRNVSVFNKTDWPSIISFLKQRMIALDTFWNLLKDGFQ
jgi:hypothetical protein